jgi:hypothetical protein
MANGNFFNPGCTSITVLSEYLIKNYPDYILFIKNKAILLILSIEKIKNYKKIAAKSIILKYGNLVF